MTSKKKTKLLYYGDAPNVSTGFGNVSENILTRLHNSGKYDITVLGVNHFGFPHPFPFPIWPIGAGSNDPYGRERAVQMMAAPENEFDILFMMQDAFILQFMGNVLPKLKQTKKFKSVVYFPVDGVPKQNWIEAMSLFDKCVTYTQFAKEECLKVYPSIESKLSVIPHGSDPKVFNVLPEKEVTEFKRNFFGPHKDKFIVTNINRNQQRKDIPRTLMAFKLFNDKVTNSILYLHMATKDQGWDLLPVIKSVGLTAGVNVLLTDDNFNTNQGYPVSTVNLIYNASNVVMSTTTGEGWGLSVTEAMSTKTPVVFPDNTSLTEIIGPLSERGYLVDSGTNSNLFTVLPNDNEVVRPLTDIQDMADKLYEVYVNGPKVKTKVEAAYKWVNSTLNWSNNILPKWEEIFSSLSKEGDEPKVGNVVQIEEL